MNILLIFTIIVVLFTIAAGIGLMAKRPGINLKKVRTLIKCSLWAFVIILASSVSLLVPEVARAADGASSNSGLGLIAVAISTGLAALGAGIAVGSVGSSALGAVTEDPGMLGRTLIFIGLAEGIAIYGLIISIIILGRI